MYDITTVTALLPDGCAFTAIDDFRNAKRSRNTSNTELWKYNCAGYALGTYNWLIPFFTGSSVDDEAWDAIYNHNGSNEDIDYEYIQAPEEYEDFVLYKTEIYDNYLAIYKDYTAEELAYWETEYGKEPLEEEDIDDEYCDQLFSHIFYRCYYDHPIALDLAATMMLKCFPDMRRISSFADVKEDEYGIAYAAGGGDFHFCRWEDGILSHKRGASTICEADDVEEVFSSRYDSDILYFAKKK